MVAAITTITVVSTSATTSSTRSSINGSTTSTAIITSTAAYENISKVAKQFGETAKSNFEAAAQRTAQGVKKAKK